MSNEQNKTLESLDKLLSGKYGDEAFTQYYKHYMLIDKMLSAVAPDTRNKAAEYWACHTDVYYADELPKRTSGDFNSNSLFPNTTGFNPSCEPHDVMQNLVEAMTEAKEKLRAYALTVPEKYRPIIEAPLKLLDWETEDICGIACDHPYLAVLSTNILPLVNLIVDENDKTGQPIKFEEMEKKLNGEENTGLFDAYLAQCQSIQGLWEAEIERRKLLREGYTPEQEQTFFEHQKTAGTQFLKAFETIKEIETTYPNKYDMNYMMNPLDHFLGITDPLHNQRVIHWQAGALKSTLHAIENGWGMNEINALSALGSIGEYLPQSERFFGQLRKNAAESLKKAENEYHDLLMEYSDKLEMQEQDIKKLDDAKKKYIQAQNDNEKTQKLIQEYDQKLSAVAEAKEDLQQLMETVTQKKVHSAQDKLNVLDQIDGYLKKHGDVDITGNRKISHIAETFGTITQKLRDDITLGTDDIIRIPEARKRFQLMLDVYSSQPKYDPARTDISKEKFEAYYMSTAYDAKDLPFNEKEIAMIGMAATLSAPKAEEAFFRQKPSTNRDHQFFIESRTLWMQDCLMHDDSTRENALSDYHEIIREGKAYGKSAMEEYQKGNKRPLAEILQTILSNNQHEIRGLAGLDASKHYYYLMTSTAENLLNRDPELAAEFDKVNASKAPDKRADRGLLKPIRILCMQKMQLDGRIDRSKDILDKLCSMDKIVKADPDHVRDMDDESRDTAIKTETANLVHLHLLNDAAAAVYMQWQKHFDQNYPEIMEFSQEKRKQVKQTISQNAAAAADNPEQFEADLQELVAQTDYQKRCLSPFPYYLRNIDSPEITEEMSRLAARIENKYTLSIGGDNMVYALVPSENGETKKTSLASVPEYKMELDKIMFENVNKGILEEVKNEELTDSQKRSMISSYIENLFHIDTLGRRLDQQPLSPMQKFYQDIADPLSSTHQYQSEFIKNIRDYTQTIDLSNLRGQDLSDLLKNNTENMLSTVDAIQSKLSYEHLHKQKNTSIESELKDLKKNKLAFRGSELYDNIVTEMDKLNTALLDAEKKANSEAAYPAADLAEREDKLIKMMNTYLDKKNKEFDQVPKNEYNTNSVKRYNAMLAAIEAVTKRYNMDRTSPNLTNDNWKAAVQFSSSIKNEKQQKAEIWKARIRSAQEDLEKLSDAEINDPNNEKLKKPLAVIITAYTAKHASPDQERTFRSNQNFDRAVQEMMESKHLGNLLLTSSRPELVKDAQKGEGRRLIEALSNAKKAEMEANQAKQSKNMKKSEPEKKNPDRKI